MGAISLLDASGKGIGPWSGTTTTGLETSLFESLDELDSEPLFEPSLLVVVGEPLYILKTLSAINRENKINPYFPALSGLDSE